MSYTIVEFIGGRRAKNSIAIVCDSWIECDDKCWWPPHSSQALVTDSLLKCEEIGPTWKCFPVRIIPPRKMSYQWVTEKIEVAEFTSDLGSDADEQSPQLAAVNWKKKALSKRPAPQFSDCEDENPMCSAENIPPPRPVIAPLLPNRHVLPRRQENDEGPYNPLYSRNLTRLPFSEPSNSQIRVSPIFHGTDEDVANNNPIYGSDWTGISLSDTSNVQTSVPPMFQRTNADDANPIYNMDRTPFSDTTNLQTVSAPREQIVKTPRTSRLPTTIFSPFERMTIRKLEKIRLMIENLSVSRNCVCQTPTDNLDDASISHSSNLPLKSIEEFRQLDEKISLDNSSFVLLIKELSPLGGSNVIVVTRKILSALFTNQLAMKINWSGKKQGAVSENQNSRSPNWSCIQESFVNICSTF